MSCEFNIIIPSDKNIDELILKAKETFEQMGGEFSGDNADGEFFLNSPVGKISGNYKISENEMNVVLTEKPMMLPCSMIENEFNKYLKS